MMLLFSASPNFTKISGKYNHISNNMMNFNQLQNGKCDNYIFEFFHCFFQYFVQVQIYDFIKYILQNHAQ